MNISTPRSSISIKVFLCLHEKLRCPGTAIKTVKVCIILNVRVAQIFYASCPRKVQVISPLDWRKQCTEDILLVTAAKQTRLENELICRWEFPDGILIARVIAPLLYETTTGDQARNQLAWDTRRAKFFSERGPSFLNYVQHIFPGGVNPPAPPWLQACWAHKNQGWAQKNKLQLEEKRVQHKQKKL